MHVFIFLEAFLVGILLHYRWRTLEKACPGITMNWLPWQRRLDIVCSQPLIPPLESLTPGLVFHCYFMHFKKLNTVHMSWLYFVLFNVASTLIFAISNTPQYRLTFLCFNRVSHLGNISGILTLYVPRTV